MILTICVDRSSSLKLTTLTFPGALISTDISDSMLAYHTFPSR